MVKILVKENRNDDNIIMSYDEQLNGMIEKIMTILSDVKEQHMQYGANTCALNLINCRNMMDELIDSIAFMNA